MTLIGEAARERDHAQRQLRIAHPFLRAFDALHDKPAMRRQPGSLMKCLHEIAAREPARTRDVGQPDVPVEMFEQQFLRATRLRRRELARLRSPPIADAAVPLRDVRLERQLAVELEQSSQTLDRGLVAAQSSPSQQAIRREQSVLLAEALGRLPEEWRELLILRHLEGLSFPEVARRLGRTIDSVKKQWPRALAGLRRLLEAEAT